MSVNMNTLNAYSAYQNGYNNTSVKDRKNTESTQKAAATDSLMTNGQKNLSKAAKELLEKIKAQHSDKDIMVADFDNGDDAKEILSRGTKEFSVLFSSEELEKMAVDEKYYEEKMADIDGAVRMSEEINAQFGFESAFGEEGILGESAIAKFGISFNSDGTTSFFAELEKLSEKQRERIEKQAEDKKEALKEEKAKENTSAKRVTIVASSKEELLKKIEEIDWSKVKEDTQVEGSKFDFSV